MRHYGTFAAGFCACLIVVATIDGQPITAAFALLGLGAAVGLASRHP